MYTNFGQDQSGLCPKSPGRVRKVGRKRTVIFLSSIWLEADMHNLASFAQAVCLRMVALGALDINLGVPDGKMSELIVRH